VEPAVAFVEPARQRAIALVEPAGQRAVALERSVVEQRLVARRPPPLTGSPISGAGSG
jgi:hypothetical protein